MANSIDEIGVNPSGKALGAEVTGIDLAQEVPDAVIERLQQIWAEHLVLLLRRQFLEKKRLVAIANQLGGLMVPGSRDFHIKGGHKPGTARVSDVKGVTLISNLGQDGKPKKFTEGSGSQELLWHSDNSYMENPPMGSLLNAVQVPVDGGGHTRFCNQYLAYATLPNDLKQAIEGKHIRHDRSRNTSGKVRVTFEKAATRDDVIGPVHPIVRLHPVTRKPALYLGRRYDGPSSYIVELPETESEALLDKLWAHATQEDFVWEQNDWQSGDLVMWDNQCVMHSRTEVDHTQARLLHRVLVQGGPPISPWETHAAAE
ncbi:MAG: TauD/TfdA family dioxygenase [Alphaproteobacteria bacterium]|nr:TauD/TfdA family dioxygenase [Alphaproteobacteria bacterium]